MNLGMLATIAGILLGAGQLAAFARWIYRKWRNEVLMREMVLDLATNHLPHIYEVLERLCEKQGLEVIESPPIRWGRMRREPVA